MKKWAAIILVSLLFVVALPQLAEANQGKNFEKNLEAYLKGVSKQRGFEVTKSDIEFSLAIYDMSLADFEDVSEIESFLGEVIRKDGSNLDVIYEDDYLTIQNSEDLIALLDEYGETLDYYVFVDDLLYSVDFYIEEKIPRDPEFDANLDSWLKDVSKIRGIEVTRKHVENSLARWGSAMEEFKTVERLSDFLGEIIEKNLGNITWIYEDYDMDKAEFLQFLKDNNLNINDYVFVDDLWSDVYDVIGWTDLEEELALILEEFGLTKEEMDRLEAHFVSIEDSLYQEETLNRLMNLADRLLAFEEFETAKELSAMQLADLLWIYNEFTSIFQLKIEFALVQDGTETPISIQDLFNIDKLVNANLLIKIYNLQGDFLADLLITGEMVDSDSLHVVGKDMKNALEEKPEENVAPAKETVVKPAKESGTEKGAKLPKTAGNFAEKSIVWLLVALAGAAVMLRMRKIGSEK